MKRPLKLTSEMEEYIEQTEPIISFLCRSQQWDGISESRIYEWLSNFSDLEGRYYALKILRNCIYYSEEDLIQLLRNGLYEKIYGKEIKKRIVEKGELSVTTSIISSEIDLMKSKTLFIPLLDKNKPHESGAQLSRYLIQNLRISEKQSDYHWNIKQEHLENHDILVIVDDCIGSGDQLRNFWSSPELEKIRDAAEEGIIRCYYMVITGYKKNIDDFKGSFKNLDIRICDPLTDRHRVFSKNSIFWKNDEELNAAVEYFKKIEEVRDIPMYGYVGMDFAVIIHKSTPDWSLPIFWKKSLEWNILVKRKNSYE